MGQDTLYAAGHFYNSFAGLTGLGSSDILAVSYTSTGVLR